MLGRICTFSELGSISLGVCTAHSQIWEQSRRLPAEPRFSDGGIPASREGRKKLRKGVCGGGVMAVVWLLRNSIDSQLQRVWGLLE